MDYPTCIVTFVVGAFGALFARYLLTAFGFTMASEDLKQQIRRLKHANLALKSKNEALDYENHTLKKQAETHVEDSHKQSGQFRKQESICDMFQEKADAMEKKVHVMAAEIEDMQNAMKVKDKQIKDLKRHVHGLGELNNRTQKMNEKLLAVIEKRESEGHE